MKLMKSSLLIFAHHTLTEPLSFLAVGQIIITRTRNSAELIDFLFENHMA